MHSLATFVHYLSLEGFTNAITLIRDVSDKVVYPVGWKYQRKMKRIVGSWHTGNLGERTLEAFAKEILKGDESVVSSIREFQKSVYASGGFFEVMIYNIVNESYQVEEELRKLFETMLEVKMKATTLIYFGNFLKRVFNSKWSISNSFESYKTDLKFYKKEIFFKSLFFQNFH